MKLEAILNFLELEAKNCEWYGQGIKLGKVNEKVSNAEQLFSKAQYFRDIVKYLKEKKR